MIFICLFLVCSNAEAIQCYECHGTKSPVDYRPLDAPYRNVTTGGFQGNHRTHLSATDNVLQCERCHAGSSHYTTGHRDGKIQLSYSLNNSPVRALYDNRTSARLQTATPPLSTCTNVNCHFENETPQWGGPLFSYPNDCSRCHGAPPAGGTTGTAGSHPKHDQYFTGAANCIKCHPDHSTFSHATSVGRTLAIVLRDPLLVPAGSYDGPVQDYLPSQSNLFGKCSNLYCHSDGTAVANGTIPPNQTPDWGSGPIGCNGCHGTPPSYVNGAPKANSHGRHTEYGFTCSRCHYGTTADNITIRSTRNHVNKFYNISALGERLSYTYASTGGNCSNGYCHSNGTSVSSGTVPDNTSASWGTVGPLSCDSCHGYPPAYTNKSPKSNSHPKHQTYGFTCNKCHAATTADGSTISDRSLHVNKEYNVAAGGGVSFTYTYATTGGTCTANSCHSDGTSISTGIPSSRPADWGASLGCSGCHALRPNYPNGSPKANSHIGKHSIYRCNICHSATTSNGTTITDPTKHLNGQYDVVSASGLFSYTYAQAGGTCANVQCHANPTGYRQWGVTRCDGCHDAPPNTPSHLKHFSGTVAQASYTSVKITRDFSSNATGYIFNCGNCHPIDPSKHGNGIVEVELHDPNAPPGSIKSNPMQAGATYTSGNTYFDDSRGFQYSNGTCSNVYCHSYNDWTTPVDCTFTNESGARYCDSYALANLTVTRKYKDAVWGSTLPNDCTGCHGNAPTTTAATNDGGTGNTHAWVDPYGWEEGHFNKWAFTTDPISCSYCHNETIKDLSKWNRQPPQYFTTFSANTIANTAKHVNGQVDVAFDRTNKFTYRYITFGGNEVVVQKSLSSASYQPETKTCSNVSCHLGQTSVKWGTPYRAYLKDYSPNTEYYCIKCHTGGLY